MKILVTGIAGFIGSHAAERFLQLGHEVVGIDNFNEYYNPSLKQLNAAAVKAQGGKIINHDLRAENLMSVLPENVDFIFHFSAHPGISSSSSFNDYVSNNILATKNLIDYALKLSDLKLFVNISTSSVYGLEATFPETEIPKPASYYGVTKLTAEQLVLQKQREQKLSACSLRLYSVYGPRERPEKMYTKLIACGLDETTFPLFEGSDQHLRSFTYVDDIIDGVVSVLDKVKTVNGEIINLGTEVEYTTQEGIDAVQTVLGKTIQINVVPKRVGDQLRTQANIDKAKKLLNYNPTTTLLEGVKKQVAWYKENFTSPTNNLQQ